jgi:hypothetical protein
MIPYPGQDKIISIIPIIKAIIVGMMMERETCLSIEYSPEIIRQALTFNDNSGIELRSFGIDSDADLIVDLV